MKPATAIAAGLMFGAAGLLLFWPEEIPNGDGISGESEEGEAPEETGSIWQRIIDGVIPVEIDLNNQNLQAFLAMIRTAEGTAGQGGYRMLFGGQLFASYADHPRQLVSAQLGGRKIHSTAAGAYQFLSRTWDEARAALSLPDFSPESQDMAAAWLIRRRGALRDVLDGRLSIAIAKCAKEWASLPGSPYGQPTISSAKARSLFAQYGGMETESA